MKILDSHAQSIEAEPPQCLQVLARGHARVDFDSDFRIGGEVKSGANRPNQVFDLVWREIGWSAAAPRKLDDLALFRNTAADPLHLLLQHAEIRGSHALILLNDHIAGAKQAEALAEWNVHVQR